MLMCFARAILSRSYLAVIDFNSDAHFASRDSHGQTDSFLPPRDCSEDALWYIVHVEFPEYLEP